MARRNKFCTQEEILAILNDIPDDRSEASSISEDSDDDFQPDQNQESEDSTSSEENDVVQGRSELHIFFEFLHYLYNGSCK